MARQLARLNDLSALNRMARASGPRTKEVGP
jgi:hypothetical protein